MSEKDVLNNVVDELNRAISRLKEIGYFEENTITSDEELVRDMESSIERLCEPDNVTDEAYIVIKTVEKKPNEEKYWSYSFDEIPYIMEQIKDSDRENGYEFHLFDRRIYESKETENW